MRVYLDTAPVIYIVQHVNPYLGYLTDRLSKSNLAQVSGELTRLETRVKPIRSNDEALLNAFDRYFTEIIAEIVPLTRTIIDYATDLRARYNFRSPDALQLASAIVENCDVFLTNDAALQKCTEIKVEIIPMILV